MVTIQINHTNNKYTQKKMNMDDTASGLGRV